MLIARPYGYFRDDYTRPLSAEDYEMIDFIRAEFHAQHPEVIEEDDYSEESVP